MNSLRIMFCFHGALGVLITAALVYIAGGRRPEFRFTLVVSLLLLAALFAFLPFIPAFRPDVAVHEKKVLL